MTFLLAVSFRRPALLTHAGRMLAAVALLGLPLAPTAFADGGAGHQVTLARPIPLGVSGGSAVDLDGAFCCGGTLGGLVQDCNGDLYLLSNNHVLGRGNRAVAGEDVIQPGLIDSGCRSGANAVVADFTEFVEISFDNDNLVDAAIAKVRAGKVDTSGSQLDIGAVSSSVTEATIGMSVQKDGRTSGHTTSTVVDVNASILVSYPKKCGGGGGPAAAMVDQFRISGSSFSTSGDSGSVIYTSGSNPQPVGLLFAGTSSSTVANRIANVLDADWGVGPLAMAGATPSGCGGGCSVDADCNDGNACTTDTCSGGSCSNTPINCDDGNACTADSCSGGSCSNDAISCDDGDVCTIDSCSSASGCSNVDDPTCVNPCGDGVCDVAVEDCRSCPDDCNGVTRGKPTNRYCCGDDTGCGDGRCSNGSGCTGTLSASSSGPRGLDIARAKAVKAAASSALFAIEDVVGHGVGLAANGDAVIRVYLARDNEAARRAIPHSLDGVNVEVVVTGEFVAYCR
jgi:hypothetical protein